ncbi:MAG: CRTAC1 family protein, partial [Chloroflexi bacterium]|nr:CRTAC1 family protein [Chloroflexota bacterium]
TSPPVPHFKDVAQEAGIAYGEDGAMRAGMGVETGDLTGDGRMDLVITNFQHEPTSVYMNKGNNLFTDASYSCGVGTSGLLRLKFGVAILDVDGDGRPDIFQGDGHVFDNVARFDDTATYRQTDQLYLNTGSGHFRNISDSSGPAFSQPSVARGVAVGDMDSDGTPYILVNDSGLPARLLHITRNRAVSWLGFNLHGVRSNRSAIGARLEVRWPGGAQTEEVRSGGSYLSQSDLRPLFGLGACKDPSAVKVTIRWPSGIVQRVAVNRLNCYCNVLEPGRPAVTRGS